MSKDDFRTPPERAGECTCRINGVSMGTCGTCAAKLPKRNASHNSNAPTAWLDRAVPPEINAVLEHHAPGQDNRTFRTDVRRAVVAVLTWRATKRLSVPTTTEDHDNVLRLVADLLKEP